MLLDVPLNESEALVHDCFGALSDPELFDTAVEAIVNAISQPDSQRYVRCLLSVCLYANPKKKGPVEKNGDNMV